MPNNPVSTLTPDLTTLCDLVLSQETQTDATHTIDIVRDLMASFTPEKHELIATLGYDVTRPYAPEQAFCNLSGMFQTFSSALDPSAQQTPVDQIDTDALRSMLGGILSDAKSTMTELLAIKKKACIIPPSVFDSPVLPVQNGPLINAFLSLSGERIRDEYSQREFINKDGHKITVDDPDGFIFGSSAKKLMFAILIYYSLTTRYCSEVPDTAVRIPLIAYGAANGLRLIPEKKETEEEQEKERKRVAERLKEFRKMVQRDLDNIGKLRFTGEQTKNIGKKKDAKTDVISLRERKFITSGTIKNGTIVVELSPEMAKYISQCPLMQFPPILLKDDNRKPNAFTLGVKIALHYSNRKNQGSGTNNTLSVKSLLACAPEIPTYEQVTANNQRNWKQKIALPLENALNENVRIDYLKKWTYRDPSAKTTYPAEIVQFFTWEQYRRLMIDYEISEEYRIDTRKPKADTAKNTEKSIDDAQKQKNSIGEI